MALEADNEPLYSTAYETQLKCKSPSPKIPSKVQIYWVSGFPRHLKMMGFYRVSKGSEQ